MERLNILSLDGIVCTGKSSQLGLFANLLNSNNIRFKRVKFDLQDEEEIKRIITSIDEFLTSDTEAVVICEGSIASSIVVDIIKNLSFNELFDKHKDTVHLYRLLSMKYNICNIVLHPRNMDLCQNRLKERDRLIEEVSEFNVEYQRTVAEGIKTFNNNILSVDMNFDVLEMNGSESMLSIQKQILEIIGSKYQIIKGRTF